MTPLDSAASTPRPKRNRRTPQDRRYRRVYYWRTRHGREPPTREESRFICMDDGGKPVRIYDGENNG